MRISDHPKDPGPAAWQSILPDKQPMDPLNGDHTSDWLVIGGGFTGLSAARRLRQLCPQDRICLLEARKIAEGPAGRNSGFMIDLPHDLASENYGGDLAKDQQQIQRNRAAIDFAEQACAEYALPSECFVRSGKINAAASDTGHANNQNFAKHLSALGEPYEHFDAVTMREITGTDYYASGLYTPGAAMLQPALYIRGLTHGLTADDVGIYENSPVNRLEKVGAEWVAGTPAGQITAPKVILAVNGSVEKFGYFKRRLMHVFTYASMTRALTDQEVKTLGGHAVWGCTPANPMGTTVRRISGTGGNRIIIRNRFTYNPSMRVSETYFDKLGHVHDDAFLRRFPMLGAIDMEYRWGGLLCLSRHGESAFGEVENNLYSACCQNGLGLANGTLSGVLAAELATGTSSELLNSVLPSPLPARLPPEPVTWIGANATIRWKEFKAGREL